MSRELHVCGWTRGSNSRANFLSVCITSKGDGRGGVHCERDELRSARECRNSRCGGACGEEVWSRAKIGVCSQQERR